MSVKVLKRLRQVGDFVKSESRLAVGLPVVSPATPSQALEQWLSELELAPPSRGRVLITALRNQTWIEWAVYCACVIRRMGFESTIVYDRQLTDRLYPETALGRPSFFAKAAQVPGIELVDLGSLPYDEPVYNSKRSEALLWGPVALAYDHHLEEMDVLGAPERYQPEIDAFASRSARLAAALDSFLRERSFHRAFCYSGLIGESKLLLAVLLHHKVETLCLEGWAWRPGHMIYNFNAPALEYNIQGWLGAIGPWDEEKEREINSYLNFLDGVAPDSDWLNNFYRIQRDNIAASLAPKLMSFLSGDAPVFLLAPNVIGDSSMLRRETIFQGQQQWVRQIIEWFSRRPDLKLLIRAHPAERWIGNKCVVYMADVARAAAGSAPNIFVIGSEESTNTLSLVPFARAGLVWLSSAGVDFVVRGLPTMVAAQPKYQGMGIVLEPSTQAEYFEQLEIWSQSVSRPTPEQIAQGKRYLHVVFKGFSFEAGGRNYRATSCLINKMPSQAEHDRFFRILVGDEPMPDQRK